MTDSDDLDRYRAPALDKGLDILELLAREEEGLSQAEIAKALGRTPNEHYRMLERLVRRGYVFRNASDRYELTLKLFGLAHFHRPIRRLVSRATPLMSAPRVGDAGRSFGGLRPLASPSSPRWMRQVIGALRLRRRGSASSALARAASCSPSARPRSYRVMVLSRNRRRQQRPQDLEERLANPQARL
jgi:DNA-binding Lrp family transcriptional regulator